MITITTTDEANKAQDVKKPKAASNRTKPSSKPLLPTNNNDKFHQDLALMVRYASERGISFPTDVSISGEVKDATLISSYNSMIKTIAPATVQSIKFIENHVLDENGRDKKWYKTPIISKCLIIASLALLLLIGVSLSSQVNVENLAAGLLSSHGMALFYNLVFICSSS